MQLVQPAGPACWTNRTRPGRQEQTDSVRAHMPRGGRALLPPPLPRWAAPSAAAEVASWREGCTASSISTLTSTPPSSDELLGCGASSSCAGSAAARGSCAFGAISAASSVGNRKSKICYQRVTCHR
jgi:hypothetical protein